MTSKRNILGLVSMAGIGASSLLMRPLPEKIVTQLPNEIDKQMYLTKRHPWISTHHRMIDKPNINTLTHSDTPSITVSILVTIGTIGILYYCRQK